MRKKISAPTIAMISAGLIAMAMTSANPLISRLEGIDNPKRTTTTRRRKEDHLFVFFVVSLCRCGEPPSLHDHTVRVPAMHALREQVREFALAGQVPQVAQALRQQVAVGRFDLLRIEADQ